MLTITKECTVADVVSNIVKTADVFKKYGIDFCCGGGISLAKVCDKNEIVYDVLLLELTKVGEVKNRSENYDNWDLVFLIDHIVNIHHKYVCDSIVVLNQYVNKVAKVHGHHYSELLEVRKLFREVAEELSFHMQKEEKILFPRKLQKQLLYHLNIQNMLGL